MSRPGTSQIQKSHASSPRGQSHVVGTVLMIGLTMIALGGLVAAVGGIVDDQTSRSDAVRVADDLDSAIEPVSSTGHRTGEVAFSAGSLHTVDRTLRVLNGTHTLAAVDADGLVYEHGNHRVSMIAGAIVRGQPGGGWVERPPPITEGEDVLVVGAPVLNGSGSVGANGGITVALTTNTTHDRHSFGVDEYRVAIETRTPGAFEAFAEQTGATFSVEHFDGDDVPSAVLDYAGGRDGYLVVHDLRLEVGDG